LKTGRNTPWQFRFLGWQGYGYAMMPWSQTVCTVMIFKNIWWLFKDCLCSHEYPMIWCLPWMSDDLMISTLSRISLGFSGFLWLDCQEHLKTVDVSQEYTGLSGLSGLSGVFRAYEAEARRNMPWLWQFRHFWASYGSRHLARIPWQFRIVRIAMASMIARNTQGF
jgi:hypothetical protein